MSNGRPFIAYSSESRIKVEYVVAADTQGIAWSAAKQMSKLSSRLFNVNLTPLFIINVVSSECIDLDLAMIGNRKFFHRNSLGTVSYARVPTPL